MRVISNSPKSLLLLALLAGAAPVSLAAQEQPPAQEQPQDRPPADVSITGTPEPAPVAAEMTEGPEVNGIISARDGDRVQVTTADGNKTIVAVNDSTRIRASGGFLGLNRSKLAADALLNGLPVSIKTMQAGDTLVASQIKLQNKDLKTASMIHNGTDQRFAEQTAATEALRGRVGDIDQYNVKGTTNVNFDTGKAVLSEQAKADLCTAAKSAEAMDNALLLVVGYTDSTGSQEFNQTLSEKRASSVINYLQQACGWKPYRMLTPTGMAEADPLADNETPEGKAQNRRVAVNVLVSKAVDGLREARVN
ncbi:OmpA family protein [Sphingomonas sp. BT-65]|uniref:OmpA family protein n=1 Tax=Sphingomonas sp. BT-65 TaxID=2989821 RepID=UPI002235991A|nr:OmpA family protein [Sphingomonas sp. BT-65]MCW4461238.1 OmpA family protein [Sphingomonas sp. BT-65]